MKKAVVSRHAIWGSSVKKSALYLAGFAALSATLPGTASAVSFTAADYAGAKAALTQLRELNLYTSGDRSGSQEVEGKVFVGGNLNGSINATNGALGAGFTGSNFANLTVVGNVTDNNVQVNAGIGSSSVSALVGGNVTGTMGMNGGTNSLKVGGSFNGQNFNPNANKTVEYGTTVTGIQTQDAAFVTRNAALANPATGLSKTLTDIRNTSDTNNLLLSNILSSLTTNATLDISNQNDVKMVYGASAATAGYAVANISAADLFSKGGTMNLNMLADSSTATGWKTLIINVTGGAGTTGNWTYNNNDNSNNNDQNVIWNFGQLSGLNVNSFFHGSILGPNLALSNSTAIEGSVAVKSFQQNGEVHLGTFNGTSAFLMNGSTPTVGAVPEAATWMQMIAGFGVAGFALRRRRRMVALAA
jgi:choice-of-anchor A domain-containing protein